MAWLPIAVCLVFCAFGIMRILQQRRIVKLHQSKKHPA
jgi:hypothetical protein